MLWKMYGETWNAECFVQTSNVRYGTANATIQRAYQNQNQSSMHPQVTPAGNSRMISPIQSSSTSSFASPPYTPMPQSQNSWLWELEKQQSWEKNNDYSLYYLLYQGLIFLHVNQEENGFLQAHYFHFARSFVSHHVLCFHHYLQNWQNLLECCVGPNMPMCNFLCFMPRLWQVLKRSSNVVTIFEIRSRYIDRLLNGDSCRSSLLLLPLLQETAALTNL